MISINQCANRSVSLTPILFKLFLKTISIDHIWLHIRISIGQWRLWQENIVRTLLINGYHLVLIYKVSPICFSCSRKSNFVLNSFRLGQMHSRKIIEKWMLVLIRAVVQLKTKTFVWFIIMFLANSWIKWKAKVNSSHLPLK